MQVAVLSFKQSVTWTPSDNCNVAHEHVSRRILQKTTSRGSKGSASQRYGNCYQQLAIGKDMHYDGYGFCKRCKVSAKGLAFLTTSFDSASCCANLQAIATVSM